MTEGVSFGQKMRSLFGREGESIVDWTEEIKGSTGKRVHTTVYGGQS